MAAAAAKLSRVFVYGSLLRGLHNAHNLGTSLLRRPGARTSLSSYVLVDSGQGYPYAIAAERAPALAENAGSLLGELYEVSEAVLAVLDELEEHPDYYRRELVPISGEAEPAWIYLLLEQATLDAIAGDPLTYPVVVPRGDWRSYRTALGGGGAVAMAWPATQRTAHTPGPHAVFSYGSNGIEQLRVRCENPELVGRPAVLRHACRVFAGASARWGGGGVASIVPCPGPFDVHGNVAYLSDDEMLLLDGFERGSPPVDAVVPELDENPYAADGMYRRQDLDVELSGGDDDGRPIAAVAYVKVDLGWVQPPSEAYVMACRRNVDTFWPKPAGEEIQIEVRDGECRMRDVESSAQSVGRSVSCE